MSADSDPHGGVTPRIVADELVRCRRRGLGRLDAVLGSEPPVELPVLQRLSLSCSPAGRRASTDRGVAIGTLIRLGIAELGDDRPEDGRLLTELFFGDSPTTIPSMSPGELLDAALRRRRGVSEAAFRRERRQACLRLGRVLLDLGAPAEPRADPLVRTSASAVLALAQDPSADNGTILEHLREMAREFDVGEALEVITTFDTPDILG
ncbi:hypothetical protein [Pseudonocardia adelaidensis]|uniref:hypothetical protein n=1 Tax=Pseudonocardia adelaidensis TaxID=648754 RepID=UPI0031EEF9C6